jgi:quercetin dioxygenase-like cupin family protein
MELRSTTHSGPVHQKRGEGEAIWAMGSLFEIKLDGADTNGDLELAEVHQPPGVATPLHRHTREAEVFYLLEGEMDYEANGVLHRLEAGSVIYLPQSIPHRFRIRGESPARILAIVTPGGLFDLYRRVGIVAERREIPEHPDQAEFGRWGATAPEFGLEVLGPPLPM